MGKFKEFIFEGFGDLRGPLASILKTKYKRRNVFIHFSPLNLNSSDRMDFGNHATSFLPLNLRPAHTDPLGIYAFPVDYLLDNSINPPFIFTTRPYMYILELTDKAKVFEFKGLTLDKVKDFIKKAVPDEDTQNKMLTYIENEISENQDTYGLPTNRLPLAFWQALKIYSGSKYRVNASINSIFRRAGYNAILDDGEGVIHFREPYQIVFLEPKAYRVLEFRYADPIKSALEWIKKTVKVPIKYLKKGHPLEKYEKRVRVIFENNYFLEIIHYFDSSDTLIVLADNKGRFPVKSFSFVDMALDLNRSNELTYYAVMLADIVKNFEEPPANLENKIKDKEADRVKKFCEAFNLSYKKSELVKHHRGEPSMYIRRFIVKGPPLYHVNFVVDFYDEGKVSVRFEMKEPGKNSGGAIINIRGELEKSSFSGNYKEELRKDFQSLFDKLGRYIDNIGKSNYFDPPYNINISSKFSTYSDFINLKRVIEFTKKRTLKLR